ncbi:hypothetical protein B0H17DRAFT_1085180 [Mycena rosella]|uniref:Uncharacterized protein n=1 Tax=Mycena rosella TaxID=1033263 RepID=A0AAD7CZQ2_MYCRO|nr:hypothetical protein B0H17DRAFT_1085180 [Mycena rosella]
MKQTSDETRTLWYHFIQPRVDGTGGHILRASWWMKGTGEERTFACIQGATVRFGKFLGPYIFLLPPCYSCPCANFAPRHHSCGRWRLPETIRTQDFSGRFRSLAWSPRIPLPRRTVEQAFGAVSPTILADIKLAKNHQYELANFLCTVWLLVKHSPKVGAEAGGLAVPVSFKIARPASVLAPRLLVYPRLHLAGNTGISSV